SCTTWRLWSQRRRVARRRWLLGDRRPNSRPSLQLEARTFLRERPSVAHPLDTFLSTVAPPAPQFQRGVGTGSQQPYGQATAQNQLSQVAARQSQPGQGGGAPAEASRPSVTAGAPPVQGQTFVPTTDRDKALFGPTQNPGEPVTAGLSMSAGGVAPPENLHDWLHQLSRLANLPGAPPQIVGMFLGLTHLSSGAPGP